MVSIPCRFNYLLSGLPARPWHHHLTQQIHQSNRGLYELLRDLLQPLLLASFTHPASVDANMNPLFASALVAGFPMMSLDRGTPLSAIWKRAELWGKHIHQTWWERTLTCDISISRANNEDSINTKGQQLLHCQVRQQTYKAFNSWACVRIYCPWGSLVWSCLVKPASHSCIQMGVRICPDNKPSSYFSLVITSIHGSKILDGKTNMSITKWDLEWS